MIETFFELKNTDKIETISMIFIITLIPFTYNIVNGISIGFIVYTILKLFTNSYREVSPAMYVLTTLFIINFILNVSMGIIH